MDWSQARERSLAQWRTIRAAIGVADPGELAEWVQAVYGLCEKAEEERDARGESGPVCRFCLSFQRQGGCLAAREQLTEALLSGDLGLARLLADQLVADLEVLEVAPQA